MTKELIYCFHCATEGHEAEDCWVGKRIADRTTIHKRRWVGLTDAERDECDWGQGERDFARIIEAKLKEKNT